MNELEPENVSVKDVEKIIELVRLAEWFLVPEDYSDLGIEDPNAIVSIRDLNLLFHELGVDRLAKILNSSKIKTKEVQKYEFSN